MGKIYLRRLMTAAAVAPFCWTFAQAALAQTAPAATAGQADQTQSGSKDSATPQTTGEVVVTAKRDEAETNVKVNNATTSTRTGQTLKELPQSTDVVTAQVIDDQQDQSIIQALQNVPSATVNRQIVQGAPSFSVRGFPVEPLTNGLSTPSGTVQPIETVERVEVLKGPAAILAGADNLGGVVNVVTKKPTADPLLRLTGEYASYDDGKVDIDASDALTADKLFSGRIIASAESASRNYGGYTGQSEYLIAPSVRLKNANTDLVVGLSTFRSATPVTPYSVLNADGAVIPRDSSTPLGPAAQGIHIDEQRYYYDLTQTVSPLLTLVSRSEYYRTNFLIQTYQPLGLAGPDMGAYLTNPSAQHIQGEASDDYGRFTLKGFGITNRLIVGANYSRSSSDVFSGDQNFEILSLTAPNPGLPAVGGVNTANYDQTISQFGVYGQDLLEWNRFHLLGSVRRTHYTSSIAFPVQTKRFSNSSQSADATSPSIGAVIDLTKQVSVYANYLKGFSPTESLSYTGAQLPNITTQNVEAGVKTSFFRGKLEVTADGFQLTESNLLASDPLHPGFSIAIPGEQGTGGEINIKGTIFPGLFTTVSYTYADYVYLQKTKYIGNVIGQPKDRYAVFLGYQKPSGAWKGFGGAIGVYGASSSYVGEVTSSNGQPPSSFLISPNVRVDANVYARFGIARLNFGVVNLMNRTNYEPSYSTTYIPFDSPRTYRASVTLAFY